ncbi:eukaryotic translation initiation factor 2B [Fomitiporia mediterranea MF3/22]|uniref:eukaryotic translation initiation factor 2B n=1 Tax=Fomitiporia mediterranea (strain MF3/22) TaxID=694068 RepID=UPI000440868E|nr:eukaryotic translation initiation factor 2B [Fomitiporia mediterranea MF3/22]EJD02759.1 eukaryotic translation initiation factor 2B [Fomitiporia mediterranea MF3/22]
MTGATLPLSIRTNGNEIEIVNQLLLPHVVEYVKINSIKEAHDAIKTMKIRGAPAIASLAVLSFASTLSKVLGMTVPPPYLSSPQALQECVEPKLDFLLTARPTAVNLGAAIRRLRRVLSDGVKSGTDARTIAEALVREARAIADEDLGRNKEMSKHGAEWLVEVRKAKGEDASALNLLTVCNTGSLATSGYGTALGLITHLFETGRLGTAYFTQTAPYHQGSRLTAYELQALQAPHVMICDTMIGSLFQNRKIHAVQLLFILLVLVVGADRIAKNGDTANKVGTYNAAVLAARHKIPFIVVAPISTVDLDISDGSQIPIEQRPWLEACLVRGAIYPTPETGKAEQAVVMLTPPGLEEKNVYNPSFDVTPAELISAIVTEKGVAVRQENGAFDLSLVV